jgi:hypothetical protein
MKYCVSYKNLSLFNFSAYVNNGIQYLKTKTLFPYYNIVKMLYSIKGLILVHSLLSVVQYSYFR